MTEYIVCRAYNGGWAVMKYLHPRPDLSKLPKRVSRNFKLKIDAVRWATERTRKGRSVIVLDVRTGQFYYRWGKKK